MRLSMFFGMLEVASFLMLLFLTQKRKGKTGLMMGFGPVSDDEKKCLELARKWRDGKSSPTKSTLQRMRDGDYGGAGTFLQEAWQAFSANNDETWHELFAKTFRDRMGWFPEYADMVRFVDQDIMRFLRRGSAGSYLLPQLQSIIESAAEKPKFEILCLFFLYALALFDACPQIARGSRPFRDILNDDSSSLVRSVPRLVRNGFKKRSHKIEELIRSLNMTRKDFEARIRVPTRFIQPDFLRRIAGAWFDIVLWPEMEKKIPAGAGKDDIAATKKYYKDFAGNMLCFVGVSAFAMDQAKELHKIDFRDMALQHYEAFLEEAESLYRFS